MEIPPDIGSKIHQNSDIKPSDENIVKLEEREPGRLLPFAVSTPDCSDLITVLAGGLSAENYHSGNIVRAACLVGQVNQASDRFKGGSGGGNDLGDSFLVDHGPETVGAKQDPVALLELARVVFRRFGKGITYDPGNHMPVLQIFDKFSGIGETPAHFHQGGVVGGELSEGT
jgi:hypothetical protein